MAGGYGQGSSDPMEQFAQQFRDIWAALRDLQRPSGTNIAGLVNQVQAALANINATVTAAINANSYDKATIDGKIASPGNIAPGNVTAAGQVQSNGGPLKSQPSHDYIVHVGNWVATWTDGDGTVGTSPSSGAVKVDLAAMGPDDVAKLLSIPAYWGRYSWDEPDAPLKAFVLAEDVQAAGFGPDIAPVVSVEPMNISADPDNPVMVQPGDAWTVNYSQLVVPLLAAVKQLATRVEELEAA